MNFKVRYMYVLIQYTLMHVSFLQRFRNLRDFFQCVFGKEADELEQSTDDERECKSIDLFDDIFLIPFHFTKIFLADYLIEREPIVNKYISVPVKDLGNLNCAAFIAGIVEAALTSSGFVSFLFSLWNFFLFPLLD